MQPWVTYGILPVFGLFNAGVAIDATVLRTLPTAVKTGLAELPEGSTWRSLIGTAFLAGIGFTMALFISSLAFHDSHFEREAQLAILVGSLLAAAVGITILLTSKATQAPGAK